MLGKYEYWKNDSGRWYWHLKAGNNRIILPCRSQGFDTREACIGNINRVRTDKAVRSSMTMGYSDNPPKHWFLIYGDTGEIYGRSEMYSSKRNAYKGFASILRNRKAGLYEIDQAYK